MSCLKVDILQFAAKVHKFHPLPQTKLPVKGELPYTILPSLSHRDVRVHEDGKKAGNLSLSGPGPSYLLCHIRVDVLWTKCFAPSRTSF
jgi:hypothetical protein